MTRSFILTQFNSCTKALYFLEFVPIEVLIGHSNSRDGTIHASKTECEFRCQLSKSKDLDVNILELNRKLERLHLIKNFFVRELL